MANQGHSLTLISELVKQAERHGADAADAVMVESMGLSVARRLGEPENIERNESKGFGLRVFIGKKQAFASSTDISPTALNVLAERVVAMAKASPEDPYTALAERELLATTIPQLDLYDGNEPDAETLSTLAAKTEDAALAIKGVTNSEGADAHYGTHTLSLATSEGFAHSYTTSSSSLSVSVVAGSGVAMERDYDYSVARHFSDLSAAEIIGRNAGEKAIRRLNPKKVPSCEVPVIFDPRVARSLVSSFASAINGAAIARGTSFLKDKMGQQIFSNAITLTDDPYKLRGLKSRPFDAEGVAGKKRALIDKGVLTSWLLDIRSAKQLGLQTTGNASRGLSSPPSPSSANLYIENGKLSTKELLQDIKPGF